MNPVTSENKPQEQNNQAQVQEQVPQSAPIEAKQEQEAPPIKTEENKKNWAEFRAQREADRKAKDEAIRKAQEESERAEAFRKALEAITNKPSPQEESHTEESEQQRIDKAVALALQREKDRLEKERKEQEKQELPERLQKTYSDFNHVINSESLDYLEYHHPEIAAPYKYMPESFEKWSALYNTVKKHVPRTNPQIEKKIIEKNLQKPGSASTPGASQTGQPAVILSEERKAANWERMRKALKGLS